MDGGDERRRGGVFWALQIPGWFLFLYLAIAQGIPAVDYDLGVAMGTQEPASRITEVGVAFFVGFAVGDVLFYIPLLLLGLIAHLRGAPWWRGVMAAALGITVYWPIVCLVTVLDASGAPGWELPGEAAYWVVLPLIAAWGLWGLVAVCRRTD